MWLSSKPQESICLCFSAWVIQVHGLDQLNIGVLTQMKVPMPEQRAIHTEPPLQYIPQILDYVLGSS